MSLVAHGKSVLPYVYNVGSIEHLDGDWYTYEASQVSTSDKWKTRIVACSLRGASEG
jgi:hypothetical protein